MESEYITTKEAAAILGKSESTVRYLLAKKIVPGVKIGGRWSVPRSRLKALLEGDEEDAA